MYVYILESVRNPKKYYVALTKQLERRLAEHDHGNSFYTKSLRPWNLDTAFWFKEGEKAILFEKYRKKQSGRAFCSKHF